MKYARLNISGVVLMEPAVFGDERCILWDDPDIGIDWPLVSGEPPLLSGKDREGVAFKDAEVFA